MKVLKVTNSHTVKSSQYSQEKIFSQRDENAAEIVGLQGR